jgi:hypothetical protein
LATYDTYAQFLPDMLHAVASIRDGGDGLLWNPYQSCGQPFLADGITGLFYPPHLLFLVLDPNLALHAVLLLNMLIGSVGMLLLARELGLGVAAACAGVLAFELGFPMSQLVAWSPTHSGPWAWLPWAIFFCERLLRRPSRGNLVGLTVVLALEMLPGFILMSVLTYQLIALRVAWELVNRRTVAQVRVALLVACALFLAPLLAAVQLVPTMEFARESARFMPDNDVLRFGHLSPARALAAIAARTYEVPFLVVPFVLAFVGSSASGPRRLGVFYLAIGLVYAVLGLGNTTPLFALYAWLPPGEAVIRVTYRMFWVSGFCLAMLTALAIDALARGSVDKRWARPGTLLVTGAAAALYVFTPGGLRPAETLALATTVAALFAIAFRPMTGFAVWAIIAALALNVAAIPQRWHSHLLWSLDAYSTHAALLGEVKASLTPQDRVMLAPSIQESLQLGLVAKTASIARLPDVYDYQPLMGRRLGGFFSMMRQGESLRDLFDAYMTIPWTPPQRRARRLLDLTAVRYVVVSPSFGGIEEVLQLPATSHTTSEFNVYSNPTAFPRARFVPRTEVIEDAEGLLQRLAFGDDDLRNVAFVEEAVDSGFRGSSAVAGDDQVRFVQNDPEHIILGVTAASRGFLLLADQFYPGWVAAVNGTPARILRANYAFRLIEVPEGESRVEFRFRPRSVVQGTSISIATALLLTLVGISAWWTPRRTGGK